MARKSQWPFTFFKTDSIETQIVVYSSLHACRHSTCIEPTWDHGGQHGQESQEGSCEEEDREEKDCEEKEVGLLYTLSLLRHIKARAVLSPGN
ncbi:MAG TPA: hypothetical protein VMT08_01895 [Bradyrhizobium sp.]|nr:hypothetical protein [Bradyrhizobium sp.]